MNGYTPSLGLRWSPHVSGRSERILESPKVNGITEGQKALRRRTIQYEGAKLVNILPPPLRNFNGKVEHFKKLLDSFLCLVPDEPKTESLVPRARDFKDKPSNSLYDWCKNNKFEWVSPLKLTKIDCIYTVKCKDTLTS